MENKRETAVEWLAFILKSNFNMDIYHTTAFYSAKKMEKEQMIEFADEVLYNAECSFTGSAYLEKDINEIYNETYGK